jgi:hypothetical protein
VLEYWVLKKSLKKMHRLLYKIATTTQKYPFTYTLPPGIPPSFEGTIGSIKDHQRERRIEDRGGSIK